MNITYNELKDPFIRQLFSLLLVLALHGLIFQSQRTFKLLSIFITRLIFYLYIESFFRQKINQRTSGPVNAHLTPGPGIYFNAFIHVYSPRAGADNPMGTNVDVNRKPLSLCPFVVSFKIISLKNDFKYILNDFIHVYSPRAGTHNPLGTKF